MGAIKQEAGREYQDIAADEAWSLLQTDEQATLIDVRTSPEWTFAGLPKLDALQKQTKTIAWKLYPTMETNPQFQQELHQVAPELNHPVIFLCKTGGRSAQAAIAAAQAGYSRCYNIVHGFEGDRDDEGRRGRINGWKASDLPWEQA